MKISKAEKERKKEKILPFDTICLNIHNAKSQWNGKIKFFQNHEKKKRIFHQKLEKMNALIATLWCSTKEKAMQCINAFMG